MKIDRVRSFIPSPFDTWQHTASFFENIILDAVWYLSPFSNEKKRKKNHTMKYDAMISLIRIRSLLCAASHVCDAECETSDESEWFLFILALTGVNVITIMLLVRLSAWYARQRRQTLKLKIIVENLSLALMPSTIEMRSRRKSEGAIERVSNEKKKLGTKKKLMNANESEDVSNCRVFIDSSILPFYVELFFLSLILDLLLEFW